MAKFTLKSRTNALKASLCALALTVGLGACTVNPYTGEQQASKAAIGAGIGVASGAIIGLLTGDNAKERRRNALIGAGVGGLAGGGIGYYMDVQEKLLRDRLTAAGVQVSRDGETILLNMDRAITFDSGKATVRSVNYETLNALALVLDEYEKTVIDIMGHTDSVGGAAANQQLSEQRARSVAQYLATQNILPSRILSVGYGEGRPIATNSTATGKQANRRVEIQISPLKM